MSTLSQDVIDRDIAAADAARSFAEAHTGRRGEAHQQLVVAHLTHMIEGYGFSQVINWIWDVVDAMDDGLPSGL